jgi:hypothetical protein
MNLQVLRWEVTWQVDPHEGFCCTVPFMNKGSKRNVQLCTNVCVLVRIISVRFGIEVLDLNQLVLHFFLCLQIVMWNVWQYSIQNFYSSFLSTWISYWNLHFFFVRSLFMAGVYGDWTVKVGWRYQYLTLHVVCTWRTAEHVPNVVANYYSLVPRIGWWWRSPHCRWSCALLSCVSFNRLLLCYFSIQAWCTLCERRKLTDLWKLNLRMLGLIRMHLCLRCEIVLKI